MPVEPKTGATTISVIQRASKGKLTLGYATRTQMVQSKGWIRSLEQGFIKVDQASGEVIATTDGIDYLNEGIFYS